jgi:subtilisin family serine protease
MPISAIPPDPGTVATPTKPVLVALAEGDEPVADVARTLLATYAPSAGARRDSIVPLLAARGFVAPLTDAERVAIAADERVDNADEPLPVTADRASPLTTPAGVGAFGQRSALPWALDRLTQRALPLDGAATFTGSGAGVTIYVIDTGIRASHAEYAGRVVMGPDFIDGGTTKGDCNGHGTKVASDAAGLTMGTARQSTIVAVRVLDCNGSGSSVTVVQGIDWVISRVQANPGAAVINMSLGVNGVCLPVNQAALRATQAGITVVAAAGNSNANACNFSPAGAPTAVTVGATDVTDTRASFSNWGSCVDVYAPGANVDGADHASDAAYAAWSGTSAASPYVAGLAALYLEQYPTATPAQVSSALVAGATPGVVKGTNVTPNRLAYLPADASAPATGTPAGTPTNGFVPPPDAKATITCVRRACTFDGRASTDASGITRWAWQFGDGSAGSGATTAHKFTRNGTFIAGLTITTARGVIDTRQDTVVVSDGAPTAQAVATCTGWTCAFSAARSTDDGTITRYAWTFANASATASSGSSPTLTRTFKAAGTYTATLIVTDDAGQTATVQVTARTTPRPPVAVARVTCTGRTCTFDGTSSTDDIAVAGYTWDFLDGTFQTGGKVTTTYASAGTKRFKLTVRNTSGLSTTMSGQFTLR